jgi:hypothetical protein
MSAPIHPDEALTLALRDLPSPSREIGPSPSRAVPRRGLRASWTAALRQSAMDGAYGAAARRNRWRLADTIAAGSGSLRALAPGMRPRDTGAPIPEGPSRQRREFPMR